MAFDPNSASLVDDIGAPSPKAFDPMSAVEAPAPEKPGLFGTLAEGAKSTARAVGSAVDVLTGNNAGVVEKSQAQAAAPRAESLDAFYKAVDTRKQAMPENPGVLDAIKSVGGAVLEQPAGAALALVEQTPNAVPSLGGALAGAKAGAAIGSRFGGAGAAIGGLVGAAGGMFAGNAALETGFKGMDAARDGSLTDAERSQVLREGATKGAVITGVDLATLGASKWIMGASSRAVEAATRRALTDAGVNVADRAAVEAASQIPEIAARVSTAQNAALEAANKLGQRAMRGGAAVGLETAGEGIGEYLGELAATGKADMVDAALESIMSLGHSGAEVAWGAMQNRKGEQASVQGGALSAAPPPQPAFDPNAGPMSRAANKAVEQSVAAPTSGIEAALSATDAGTAAPEVSPFDQRLSAAQSFVDDKAFIQALRGTEGFGPESVTEVLSAFAKARNPNVDPIMRERAMSDLEGFINTFNSRPNFVFGQRAQRPQQDTTAPGTDIVPAQGGAVSPFSGQGPFGQGPFDDGMTLDGEFRTPAARMAGDTTAERGLPTAESLQAKRNADAAYEQAFQDLVKADQLGASDAAILADQRRREQRRRDALRAEIETADADTRNLDARERASATSRLSVLESVLADPETRNPATRFVSELRRQGYADIRPTKREQAVIKRYQDVVSALDAADAAANAVEPAAPNELDAAAMGIRERQPKAQPTPPKPPARLFPFANREAAQRQADKMSAAEGRPYVVGDHPIRAGAFAAMPAADVQQGAANAQATQAPAAANLQGVAQPAAQNAPAADGVVSAQAQNPASAQQGGVSNGMPPAQQVAQEGQAQGRQEGEGAGSESAGAEGAAGSVTQTAVTVPTGEVEPAPFFVVAPTRSGEDQWGRVEIPVWSTEEASAKVRELVRTTGITRDQFGAGVQLFDAKTGQYAARINYDGEVVPTETREEAQARSEAAVAQIKGRANGVATGGQKGEKAFAPETGTLGIPRAEMPQVPAKSHGGLVKHLNAQGIAHETTTVDAASLKPTQDGYSPEKVEAAKTASGDRAVIVSSDGHIVDGHHQALAAAQEGKPVKAIVLDAPIGQALEAVKKSPSASPNAAPAQPARQSRPTNLLQLVRQAGGVSMNRLADVTGDSNPRRAGAVGVFTKNGMDLDGLAELLQQNGFMTEADVSDTTSGAEQAADLLRQALSGERVLSLNDVDAELAKDEERKYRDRIRQRASEIGVRTTARKFDDVEADVLRYEEQAAFSPEDRSAYALDFAGIESMPQVVRQYAELADSLFDENAGMSGTAADRLLGFTEDEINAENRKAEAGAGNAQADDARAAGAGAGAAAPIAQDQGQGQGGGESLLSGYTNADIAQRESEQRAQQEAEQRAEREAVERDRKAREQAEIRARSTAAADTFELGMDPMANLTGQGDIFSQPAQPAAPKQESRPTPEARAPQYVAGDRVVAERDVMEGDIVTTPDGKQWMAKVKRGRSIPVVPFENGKPVVSAETARRFDLDETEVTHTGTNFYGYGGQPKPSAVVDTALPSDAASALSDAGLSIRQNTTKNGTPVWEVTGNTREHSTVLKRLGGRWYGPKKAWSFYDSDPSAKIAAALKPADATPQAVQSEQNANIERIRQRMAEQQAIQAEGDEAFGASGFRHADDAVLRFGEIARWMDEAGTGAISLQRKPDGSLTFAHKGERGGFERDSAKGALSAWSSLYGEAKPAPQMAPGTRVNGRAERNAASRIGALLDTFDAGRGSQEGSARDAMRRVVEELRKERTAVSVDAMLTTAAQRLAKNHHEQSEALYAIAAQLNDGRLLANPKTVEASSLNAIRVALAAGSKVHFDYAGADGRTLWVEYVGDSMGWKVVSQDDGRAVMFEKGGDPRGGGFSFADAVQAVVNDAEYRFTEWKPVAQQRGEINAILTEKVRTLTERGVEQSQINKAVQEYRGGDTTLLDDLLRITKPDAAMPAAQQGEDRNNPTDDAISDAFKRRLAERMTADEKKPKRTRKPKAPSAEGEPSQPAPQQPATEAVQRTAGQAAKSAASNAWEGISEFGNALGTLFGGHGRLSSGLTFDEETYAKAKPIFAAAYHKFRAAGADLIEVVERLVDYVFDNFGSHAAANMEPYVVQFVKDARDGKIGDASTDALTEAVEPASVVETGAAVAQTGDLSDPARKFAVARDVADHFVNGGSFNTIIDARKFIADRTGQKIAPSTQAAKQADETVETGIVLAARDIIAQERAKGSDDAAIYDRLMALHDAQPNLAVRSSTSVRDQAYSTPVPLAFVASRLAGINEQTSVYEPTAGNGMLVIASDPASTVANELNPDRAEMLARVMPQANVRSHNAAEWSPPQSFNAVIMNPPFGAIKDAAGNTVYHDVLPGYTTREIDHAIAFKALGAMSDDGRAVLIVGGVDARSEEQRREGYRGKSKRDFYFHLYNQYNVVDHFTVDGDMYAKQGAGYPVDVVVINGRGKSSRNMPAADLPQLINTYAELKGKLNEADRMVPARNGDAGRIDRGEGDARRGDGAGVAAGAIQPTGSSGGAGARSVAGNQGRNQGAESAGANGTVAGGQRAGDAQPRATDGNESVGNRQEPVSGNGEPRERGRRGSDGGRRPDSVGGSGAVGGERVQSGLSDRRGQEQETAHQAAYQPRSSAPSVGTLVPKNMRDPIEAALSTLENDFGSLDEFVAEALEFDPETLKRNFSAEQVDALALAINNAAKGRGFIIGDQTGVGKGRVVAAMIRYALVRGKVPIFVTEKPNLYADMIRDLDDIGLADDLGLERGASGILITNGSETIPYTLLRTQDGEVTESALNLRAPASGKALDARLQAMRLDDSLGDYKVIFTTYSQLQTVKGKETERQRFIKHFGAGNYMIFDESHNAGGAGETQARTTGQRAAQKAGESLAVGRAAFVRELVRKADGTFFSSATYAKRPDVMDLYSSTNMLLAVNRPADLAPAIQQGGVPMQQMVAAMLTKDGQYIRRERTFAGVSYDTRPAAVDKQTAENMAAAMRSILMFSRAKESVVKAIQKELDKSGGMVRVVGGESVSVQGANFGSVMHNLIDQMLLSLKAQESVAFAIERLKAGEKVVLTVSNTMGSFLHDYAQDMDIKPGDPVALSFKDLYLRYLEKQRIISIKQGGSDESTKHRLTDAELGSYLTEMYKTVAQQIEQSGFGSAPMSPIDYMHAELRKAGFKTDEITGRSIVLNYGDGGAPTLGTRSANIKQRLGAIRGFNSGDTDALILNQSGSTGLSLHASSKFKDQRKRHMIIVQAEKNIDTHMQMLGRVHRTGQVIAPAYSQMTADVPAEMRPAAVLTKKMAALNANTTAARESAVMADGAIDFMNDYGGQVVHEYLADNPDVLEAIGGSAVIDVLDDPSEASEDDIRKFTGYIPVLPIKQQEEVYADLMERYQDLIERENSMGTNKLEARALDLDAKTLESEAITPERGGDSEFARPAFMERVDVKRTVKPFSTKEVREMVAERLGGRTADDVANDMLRTMTETARAYAESQLAGMRAAGADDLKISQTRDKFNAQFAEAKTRLQNIKIGDPVSIKSGDGTLVQGVVIDVQHQNKTKNPLAGSAWKVTFALANGESRTMSANFRQIGSRFEVRGERRTNYLNPETNRAEFIDTYDLFDRSTVSRREKRWMVTGNMLAGFAAHAGQIVNYTTADGVTQPGILMPRTFDYEKLKKAAKVPMRDAQMMAEFIRQAGSGARLGTPDLNLQIENKGWQYIVSVPSSKREGGTYYLDAQLTDALGVDFYKSGPRMIARTDDAAAISRAFERFIERGDNIVALSNQDVARKVAGLEDVAPASAMPGVLRSGSALPETITVDGKQRPTRNSSGRLIHPTEEGVRNFWRWFGESKAIDADNRPRVVYHGTAKDFSAFDRKKVGSNYRADRKGFFFTANPSEAEWAASDAAERRGAEGDRLLPVYLSIISPVEIDASRTAGFSASGYYDNNKARIIEQAKEKKADGIIVRGAKPDDVLYVVFRPEQIKSAIGNTGTFSPDSPSIVLRTADNAPQRVAFGRVDADAFLAGFVERYPSAPPITIVNTFDQLPASVQQEARNQGSRPESTKGVMVEGQSGPQIYLVSGNHASLADFEATVFHEVQGHAGVRALYGNDFVQDLNAVFLGIGGQGGLVKIMNARGMGQQAQEYIRGIQQAQATDRENARQAKAEGRPYTIRWTDAVAKAVLTEEVYAHIAEQMKDKPSLLDKFKTLIGQVRQWLRDHTFMELARLGETDLLFVLAKARKQLERPSGGPGGGRKATVMQAGSDVVTPDGGRLNRNDPDFASAMRLADVLGLRVEAGPAVFSRGASASPSTLPETLTIDGIKRPTRNSNGQLIHPTEEGVRNFWKWFGSSRVVDEQGRPLVVYRGGGEEFDEARVSQGLGTHFGTTAQANKVADRGAYGDVRDGGERTPSVIAAYLKIENPWVFDGDVDNWDYTEDLKYAIADSRYDGTFPLTDEQWAAGVLRHGTKDKTITWKDSRYISSSDQVRAILQDNGVDGIVYDNRKEGPGKSYIAFRPEQIKSATGNTGAFSPDSPLIVFRTAGERIAQAIDRMAGTGVDMPEWLSAMPKETQDAALKAGLWTKPQSLTDRLKDIRSTAMKRLQQGLFDQFAPLKELGEREYVLARLTKSSDAPLEALLMYGKPFMNQAGAIDVNPERGGLIGALQKLNGEHDRFFAWMAGNRAEQLKKEGRENLFTDTDISALKDLASGNMGDGRPRAMVYAEMKLQFNGYSKSVLDIAEKAGIIGAEDRAVWEKDFYVPFYRAMEDGDYKGPKNVSGLVNQYAFKKLKGGTDNLNDLMQNTLRNWSHLLSASLKNQAASVAIAAAERAGVAVQIGQKQKGSVTILGRVTRAIPKGQTYTENGVQKVSDGTAEIEVTGEKHYMIEDPFILNAITSLEWAGWNNPAMKWMQQAKHYLTLGVTISPTFKIRNLMRDQIAAIGQNPVSYNILNNLSQGWKGTDKESTDYARMLAGGGLMRFGSFLEDDRAQHMKRLIDSGIPAQNILDTKTKVRDALGKAWDWWQDVGDRSENITRAAIYKQRYESLLKDGKTADEAHLLASYAARDSMDFSLQGQWGSIRFLTQLVPFLNARLQGLYKLGREGIAPTVRIMTGDAQMGDKERAQRFGAVVGTVALASIALMLAYQDDDDWKRREEWDRDAYWWFKVGGTAFRIPKPFEIGALGTIAERGLETAMNGMDAESRRLFGARMWDMVMNTFAMNPVPQLVKPLIDLYANTDSFTGRPIESMGMERLSKSERIAPNTSATAQLLGKATSLVGLSPVQLDHLIDGYFAWLGTHLVMTADFALRPMMGLPDQPARKWPDGYFVVGDFAKDLPSSQSKYVTQFYEQSKKVQQAMADIRYYQSLGMVEKVLELKEENIDKLRLHALYSRAEKHISDLNKQIRVVQASGKDAAVKRDEIDRLSEMRNRIAEATETRRAALQ